VVVLFTLSFTRFVNCTFAWQTNFKTFANLNPTEYNFHGANSLKTAIHSVRSTNRSKINMCRSNKPVTQGDTITVIDCTTKILVSTLIALIVSTSSVFAMDVSRDISGQNWSDNNYERQDFSGIIAVGTKFQNSNLQGCNFERANLMNADLSGADIRGASFQNAVLDGAKLKDVNAVQAIFSESILDVGSFENADLTDSLWPSKLQIMICDMPEFKGTSKSGVNTKDSILCH
jgi:uncharacterized protein YjbI with pentapeptide repeats